MGKEKRNIEIDIMRGMAVVFVVLAHCGFPYSRFLYLFHTSVFFICSGYFWDDRYTENLQGLLSLVINKIKKIWFPYVIWNGVFLLLNNTFCRCNIYLTDPSKYEVVSKEVGAYGLHAILSIKDIFLEFLKICLFMGGTELGGASWFLRVLFFLSVMFGFGRFITRRLSDKHYYIIEIAVGIIFSFLGRLCRTYALLLEGQMSVLFENVGVCLMAYVLFLFGNVIKLKFENIDKKLICIGGTIGTIIIYFTYPEFVKMTFGICNSVLGWFMLWGVMLLIKRYSKIVSKILSFCGMNSMYIFMGHFACFKLGNIIVVYLFEKLPHYYTGAFTCVYGNKYWLLYTIIGVGVPLLVNELNNNVKCLCKRKND